MLGHREKPILSKKEKGRQLLLGREGVAHLVKKD